MGHHNPISVEQQKQKQKQSKSKAKTKSTTMAATSPPLRLQTATPVPPLLLPLQKQSQQWRQHMHSSGISSSRVVAAAAHYFELPCSIILVFPACKWHQVPSLFLIRQYPSEKMILGTKNVTESPQLPRYVPSMMPVTFWGELVLPPLKSETFEMLLKYLWGDKYFYRLSCSSGTQTTFCVISVTFLH
jgi:hypothetical protein